jgi:hypothetical protein
MVAWWLTDQHSETARQSNCLTASTLGSRRAIACSLRRAEVEEPLRLGLRLMSDGQRVHRSSIVRSSAQMRAMVETWRSAMLEKGWQASDCEPNRKIPSEPATTEDEIPTLDHAPNPPADHAHRHTGGES